LEFFYGFAKLVFLLDIWLLLMGKIKWCVDWWFVWLLVGLFGCLVFVWLFGCLFGCLVGAAETAAPYEGCVDMARCHILLRAADGI